MKNAELHNHSYYSDGQISPKELVRLAKKRKIKHLALTDHNSVNGVEEAIQEGMKIGVNVIPGVEVECEDGEVLGYFVDFYDKEFLNVIKKGRKLTENNLKRKCVRLKEAGYKISFKDIQKKFPKSKNNLNYFFVLFYLYKAGYGKPMELGKGLNEVLEGYNGPKKLSFIQAIKLIKKAKGVPVLAHPWLSDDVLNEKTFKKLVKAGLKGIESNNGDRAPLRSRSIDKKIKKLAKKYHLITTSGSDYHGEELVKLMPGDHRLGNNKCEENTVKKLWMAK